MVALRHFAMFSTLVAAVTVLASGRALAAPEPCGTMVLYGHMGDREATYVDFGPEGVSAGDQRIGSRSLVDDNGEIVGRIRWITTILSPGADGSKSTESVQRIIELEGGELFGRALNGSARPFHDATKAAIVAESVIVGGTGAYRNARGTVVFDAKDNHKFSFDLTCD